MGGTLFVIVGAGASHDAASQPPSVLSVKPPLVKGLFDESHQEILARYPLAQSAAPEIQDAMGVGHDGQAISLETHLRTKYRDSEDPYDRRRFFSITLYLQDLLWQASSTRKVHFDNTDRLVALLLRHFNHVCFVTLNYDLILDQALGKLDPLDRIDQYTAYDRWSLIKLHGSVNWGLAPLDGDVSVDDPPANLLDHLDSTIYLGHNPNRPQKLEEPPPRYIGVGGPNQTKLFPALSVPVGEEDEVVCPESHQRFLGERLSSEDELDLLILGYSAYDKTVLERLARSEKRIRSLTVVNDGPDAAQEVVVRLREAIPQSLSGTSVEVSDWAFGEWCRKSLAPFASRHPALA